MNVFIIAYLLWNLYLLAKATVLNGRRLKYSKLRVPFATLIPIGVLALGGAFAAMNVWLWIFFGLVFFSLFVAMSYERPEIDCNLISVAVYIAIEIFLLAKGGAIVF